MDAPAEALLRDVLSPNERVALAVARQLNRRRLPRRLTFQWNTQVLRRVVAWTTRSRLRVYGERYLEGLSRDRGVLLAPNHRSLFDLFVVASAAYRYLPRARRVSFPVRSNFWYDTWLGLACNAFVTGCAMYPPIFRPGAKRAVTRAGLDELAEELGRPQTLSGMHPEGTRGKGPDPYALLPPEPSFGRVVLQGRPNVVPVFVIGLGNSLLREIRSGAGPAQIRVWFGAPLQLPEEGAMDAQRLRDQVEISRWTLAAIERLARRDQESQRGASSARQ